MYRATKITHGSNAEETMRQSRRQQNELNIDVQSGRGMARAWSLTVPERQRQQAAWAFIKAAVDQYVELYARKSVAPIRITPPNIALPPRIAKSAVKLAQSIGQQAADLPLEQACYLLSATYTALIPCRMRSAMGMYYTPPALTKRLLDMAEESGIDWRSAHILDPACGGGAFLLPVALRMRAALERLPPTLRLETIQNQLRGFEIDPFAAWLTQTWVELALSDLLAAAGKRLSQLVQVCDTLNQEPSGPLYDLVVGNPPYGRISLSVEQRQRFKRSLYGHANVYGVFTDVALRWTKPAGVIAYVTPTSFLAGEYFKQLRALLAAQAPPIAVDFIDARRGVFDDVLQEALLATYRRAGRANGVAVHYLAVSSEASARISGPGRFTVPHDPAAPWLAPRAPAHQVLIDRLAQMPCRLRDWGYCVSTGPLVWNRFKAQLRSRPGRNIFPLIWAEAVTADGRFIYRAERRGHQPYFLIEDGDEWLKVAVPCVLIQRTTAKEQTRRLIAAEMPSSFVEKHGAVVVENHLNMVRAEGKKVAKVNAATLATMLNSAIADQVFRCISGSVAVSAFELEALPLPAPEDMAPIENLIRRGADPMLIEAHVRTLYLPRVSGNAASPSFAAR